MAKKSVKKPSLNEDDRSLWDKVTESVTPMMRSRFFERVQDKPEKKLENLGLKAKTAKPSKLVKPQPQELPPSRVAPKTTPANLDQYGYGGISRSSARSIKTGQAGYSRIIDLHGYGRDEAFMRLKNFITTSVNQGHRHVLVITGKGTAGKGVIRSHLPIWLDEEPLSGHVIAYCQAQPKDGGAGAWYVNLRRRG